MLARRAKSTFYTLTEPLMLLNAVRYRMMSSPRTGQGGRVHLGPGKDKYLPLWVNVDANMFTGKCDVWADLRHRLPFRNESLDAIYSHHVIEHLGDLAGHFADVFRCLKPGGVYRVCGPNGDGAIREFVAGNKSWFSDWPDRRESIGGRLDNFILCRGEHVSILTESFLSELATNVGFVKLRRCLPVKETGYSELFSDCLKVEHESDFQTPHTLVMEVEKPNQRP